ncbi:hypothetical protein C8J56DRAFT_1090030 [Mycena floridula]|nr:hypothetical protein C8J56DRAFT_1090030 [Mycena floridula]
MATFELPLDIIEEIVGHHESDKPTLRSLCLVSKDWRSSAVVHLFSTITVSTAGDLDKWHDLTLRTPSLANRTFPSIHPEYQPLKVYTLSFRDASDRTYIGMDPCLLFNSDLTQFLSSFLGIVELRLSNLSIFRCDLAKLVHTLDPLSSLNLQCIHVLDDGIDEIPACDLSSLTKVYMDSTVMRWFDEFLAYSRPSCLRWLAVEYDLNDEEDPISILVRILDLAASSLEHLCLDLYDDGGQEYSVLRRMTQPLENLRRLDLHVNGHCHSQLPAICRDIVPTLILQDIVIELYIHRGKGLETDMLEFDWKNFTTNILPEFERLTLNFIRIEGCDNQPFSNSHSIAKGQMGRTWEDLRRMNQANQNTPLSTSTTLQSPPAFQSKRSNLKDSAALKMPQHVGE